MRISGTRRSSGLAIVLVLVVGAFSGSAYSSEDKNAKADADISAIGHRVIGHQYGYGNWYSLDKEKEVGAQVSAAFEKSTPLLYDSIVQGYLDRLAQKIAQNSDSQLPITLRVIDSDDTYAMTMLGGYQYISRGFILQFGNEGELAAAISRGIAHTALRSATREATRNNLAKIMAVPVISAGQDGVPANTTNPDAAVPLMLLKFRREDESAADYFGVQYLYKSGYDPECFIAFIQKAWPLTPGKTTPKAFSPFPPLSERVKALKREIGEILPLRNGAITNTDEFAGFREHLVSLAPPKPLLSRPTLVRSAPQQPN